MAYCGYADVSMVIMFIVGVYLFLLSGVLLLMFLSNNSVLVVSFKLFNMGFFGDFELMISIWSLLFLIMVVLISSSVMVFSFSYMSGYMVTNFVLLYLSFIVSMLWLILSNNFYWMMFGWDGLGVVSFLLIVFYMNYESVNNGLFTLFQNRIGDLFFVFFMVGLVNLSLTSNLIVNWSCLLLLLGSCVKSAQYPFNSWLLAAMSAPTPISSLVHSSTLVVAGVFIMLQFSYCLMDVLEILKIISVMSLLISSFGLLNELDMKKLIAYSTMSHVSLMMYLYSFKLYKIVYFHLNIHATFKSLMFMCFGFVMLSSFHAQDKRLVTIMNVSPFVKLLYYFSCLCLAGLPFLSGFFSKDLIIEKFMENSLEFSFIFMLILFLAISIYYSIKLMSLSHVIFAYVLVDKSILGGLSVFIMTVVSVLFINIYLSLVFSLSLELFSFKIYIYFLIVGFLMLSLMTNLNYKLNNYDKNKNFVEIWALKVYEFDKFIYWNMFVLMSNISFLNSVKMILLVNWWVMILFIMVF